MHALGIVQVENLCENIIIRCRILADEGSNPVLGETFEDRGRNFIAEKVCHHPTVIACHAHGNGWEYWATAEAASTFTGNTLHIAQTRLKPPVRNISQA